MVNKVTRRKFIKQTAATAAAIGLSSKYSFATDRTFPHITSNRIKKAVILGFDGMDPGLIRRFIAEGELPTFKKLMDKGFHFGELQTTMPPHSPVAWSSFITGTNPGGHGIFDFVHRDPSTFTPFLSTSRSFDGNRSVTLGNLKIPIDSGRVELMRRGTPFWNVLENHGIPSTIFQIPANFPVSPSKGFAKQISGMGTPDLLGSYGTFTYFSELDVPGSEQFTGGRVVKLTLKDHQGSGKLVGPRNPFKVEKENSQLWVKFIRDPGSAAVKITISSELDGDGTVLVLNRGEWSDWVPVSFELLYPFSSVAGMVRFYIKDIHPYLKVYVSPINVDPLSPTLPISSPDSYSKDISRAVGRFYTQGFPSDSKGLSSGVLDNSEYLAQAKLVIEESRSNFEHEFNQFTEGVFFFYFSSVDQNSHMMWRCMDPTHPLYEPNESKEVKGAVKYFYRQMDEVLNQSLSKLDSRTLLLAMSDHGFAPFKREFHLSTWLVQNGYTVLTDPSKLGQGEFYRYVDWSRTRAYALGINGLYFNLRGRERWGIVEENATDNLRNEIRNKLISFRDPKDGAAVITDAYDPNKIYSGPWVGMAPDMVIGYNRGFRVSDEAVLGKFPLEVIGDRTDKWSADHCLDPAVVPGMMLSSMGCNIDNPGLWDIGPSLLKAFGLEPDSLMTGRSKMFIR